jgi:hypothetical protein
MRKPDGSFARRPGRPRWKRLGLLLHRLSFIKIAFTLLGAFFQVQAMFFSRGPDFAASINAVLANGEGSRDPPSGPR